MQTRQPATALTQQQLSHHHRLCYTNAHTMKPNQSNAFQSHIKSIYILCSDRFCNVRLVQVRLHVSNTFQTVNFRLCRFNCVLFPPSFEISNQIYPSILYVYNYCDSITDPNVIYAQSQFEMRCSFSVLFHLLY